MGIPFGPIAWFVIVVTVPMAIVIAFLLYTYRFKGSAGGLPDGVRKIIASTGDVSSGIAGTKKVRFIKTPGEALVFLKIEENAIQQALSAVDYYTQEGEVDSSLQGKLVSLYRSRLTAVQAAIAKDEELKAVVDADSAMDRARSDYLRKLAAMSGTTVEADTTESGPPSVGAPSAAAVTPSDAAAPSVGPPSGGAPSGGPPGGGAPSGGSPPSGGAPSGGAPSGGPPGGEAPSGESPSKGAPSGGPPGGGAPSGGGPPGGAPSSGGPPGGAPSSGVPSGPPGSGVPSGPPGGTLSEKPSGAPGKSSLQSEMLAEMERLRTLMSGD